MLLTGILLGAAALLTVAGIFEFIHKGDPEIPEKKEH